MPENGRLLVVSFSPCSCFPSSALEKGEELADETACSVLLVIGYWLSFMFLLKKKGTN